MQLVFKLKTNTFVCYYKYITKTYFKTKMHKLIITFIALCGVLAAPMFSQSVTSEVKLSGNAYVSASHRGATIQDEGLIKWTSEDALIDTYIYFHEPQNATLSIKGTAEGESIIMLTFNNNSKEVKIDKGDFEIKVGDYQIDKPGYMPISLKGVSKSGDTFANVQSFLLTTENKITYVGDFSHYWGRRGPSVHLKYNLPEDEQVEWFYNEVTVAEGDDVVGSYYMSNGFGEGYFGIQCNSPRERRVLFSVWSPFDTQDPNLIPEHQRIKMLRRGEGVHIGEFGNEGSGGQSYLRYDWKAGNTYKFLTQIKPDGEGNTLYTAYFYATDENRWRLIASFLRPETDTYYKGAHSFLENFLPTQGHITRRVMFSNQWSRTVSGKWVEATKGTFTYDNTAHQKARLDYQGGYESESNSFYLQNCGFFNESTIYGTTFDRVENGKAPEINFEELEKL